ncbi:MAG: glycosyltransferase [Oscillospiraceae bacterium]|nr:glycosyltransferase [Oscillospiraceae bacterium]
MSTNINFSVVISHYNSFVLLKKLINSIPEREDVQIILVDDNSEQDIA